MSLKRRLRFCCRKGFLREAGMAELPDKGKNNWYLRTACVFYKNHIEQHRMTSFRLLRSFRKFRTSIGEM